MIRDRLKELRDEDPYGRRSGAELERQADLEDLEERAGAATTVEELREVVAKLIRMIA